MYGYAGKQLRIQLDKQRVTKEDLNYDLLKKYLGGVGYAARILYDELSAGIDPLGPENKVVFTTSPLIANNVPGGGSIELCFKSPLTGSWGEARCGGDFGPEMRKAGYDFIIIEGQAAKPLYLYINDGQVEFRDAAQIKGMTIREKTKAIQQELNDKKLNIMTIGPAGENLVRYSTVMYNDRAAGRNGAGAVLGSKNILAVAVKGTGKVEPANSDEFIASVRKAMKVVKESPDAAGFKEHGTTGDIPGCDELGDWPTKNWQSNSWGKGDELYECFFKNNLVKNKACYTGCPIACGRVAEVKEGIYKTPPHEGAEYESISAFTAFLLNEDMDAAVHSTYLCNELGIDTISTGSVIAFAMECYEKGIIKQNDTELELNWGNANILPELVEKISYREGIGDLLAEGVKRAAQKLGKGSEEFAIHGKGLEVPAHDPRSGKALAVTYATGNRGACHIHPLEGMTYDAGKVDFGMIKYGVPDPEGIDRWAEEGKGRIVKLLQDGLIIPDVLSTCKFFMYVGLTLDHYAEMLAAMTGWEITGEGLLKIGERVSNLQRLFNMREGFTRADDQLPERVKKIPSFGSYSVHPDCAIKDLDKMLDEYYQARKWDRESGHPSDEILKELEIK